MLSRLFSSIECFSSEQLKSTGPRVSFHAYIDSQQSHLERRAVGRAGSYAQLCLEREAQKTSSEGPRCPSAASLDRTREPDRMQ